MLSSRAHKICFKVKLYEEINKIKSIFSSLGYPLEVIEKNNQYYYSKTCHPYEYGPNKCSLYFRKEGKLLKKIKKTFGAVNLRQLIPPENPKIGSLKILLLIQNNAT